MLFLLCFSTLHAMSPQEFARKRQQEAQNTAQTTNPNKVPGFQTDTPPETVLNDHHALEAATASAFTANPEAAFLKKSAEVRPYFRIDLEHDPLIQNSTQSIENPEAILAGPLENRESLTQFKVVSCQEAKPEVALKCVKNLLPPEFSVEGAKYSNWWCSAGNHRPDDPGCSAKAYFSPARMFAPEKIHVQRETWTSTCQALESKEKQKVCKLVTQECPQGPETRDVVGKMGDQSVTRPISRHCWRYELTYACAHPSLNTCEALRKTGCEQIKSECLAQVTGTCVEWKQTLRCPVRVLKKNEQISHTPYKLPKSPLPAAEAPSGDMAEAMSKLSILQEVQGELRSGSNATSLPLIFKGQGRACTIAFAGFKNCCSKGKGWGLSLGISGCDGEERDLAERREKGLCHEIGTYCAQKALGVCIRKKRQFCCFPSKLSRILHVQGRTQLSINWGSAEHPDCRGFTADELSRLNFDRLDLAEIYTEISARVKQSSEAVVKRNLSERIQKMTHGLKNKSPQAGM